MFTLFHIFYIALTQSAFVQIFLFIILYSIAYLETLPKKNWYGYDDNIKSKNLDNKLKNTLIKEKHNVK